VKTARKGVTNHPLEQASGSRIYMQSNCTTYTGCFRRNSKCFRKW